MHSIVNDEDVSRGEEQESIAVVEQRAQQKE